MAKKVRFDYSKVGLSKEDFKDTNGKVLRSDKVTFDGYNVEDLPYVSQTWCADYGLFVALTRTLAGNEKASLKEKHDLIQEKWDWLMNGMPAITRTKVDAFTSACQKVMNSGADELTINNTIAALELAFNKKFTPEQADEEIEDGVGDDE